MRITVVAAALMLFQTGCRWTPGQNHRPPGRIQPTGQPRVTQASANLGRKTVASKQEPNRLTAADGTVCTVPEKQFRETVVGTDVTCLWGKN